VLAGLMLSVGLVIATSGQAATSSGDCKNDNTGLHNGYTCTSTTGGGNAGGDSDSPGAGKPVDDTHGDCKNDNTGNHNGYVCSPGDNTGQPPVVIPGGSPSVQNNSTPAANGSTPAGDGAQQGVLGERVRACASRRSFTIHIQRHNGVRFRSAQITFRGKVVASRHGNRRVMAPIVLKRLPRGTFRVHIRVVTTTGHVIKGTRTYHTCAKKRPPHAPPKL
jgi:hypothetical protein